MHIQQICLSVCWGLVDLPWNEYPAGHSFVPSLIPLARIPKTVTTPVRQARGQGKLPRTSPKDAGPHTMSAGTLHTRGTRQCANWLMASQTSQGASTLSPPLLLILLNHLQLSWQFFLLSTRNSFFILLDIFYLLYLFTNFIFFCLYVTLKPSLGYVINFLFV